MAQFFLLTDDKGRVARKERGRARWSIDYQGGTLAFAEVDAVVLAQATAEIITTRVRENLSRGKKADGRRRRRKTSWRISAGKSKTGKGRKVTAQEQVDRDKAILNNEWPGKKPRKPTAPKRGKRMSDAAWAKRVERYEQALKRYKRLMRSYPKQKYVSKERKKHFRLKGKIYTPSLRFSGVKYSGLLADSISATKPRPSKRLKSRGPSGRGEGAWGRGQIRITAHKSRMWAIEMGGYLLFDERSGVHGDIAKVMTMLHTKATKRASYQETRRTSKAALMMAARAMQMLLRHAVRLSA